MLLNSLIDRYACLELREEPYYFGDATVLRARSSHVVFVFFQRAQNLDVYVSKRECVLNRSSVAKHSANALRSAVEILHYFLDRVK